MEPSSHIDASLFHPLEAASDKHLPKKFNCPFCYTPHPLAIEASEQVKKYISRQEKWEGELEQGKMFGVLVVQDCDGNIGFLAAFSGNIDGKGTHPYFVPPIFDPTLPDGHFKAEEQRITQLNQQISRLESDNHLTELKTELERQKGQASAEIEQAKATIRQHKAERDKQRSAGITDEQNAGFIRQSQFEKAELKRLERRWTESIGTIASEIERTDSKTCSLKEERKQLSEALQQWLFGQYVVLNAKGERKSIKEIFEKERGTLPPAATGDCAAPKLLQYSFCNGLKPLAMAEFWWGDSPTGEIRHHGTFYPACHSKCEPILDFMLRGLDVEPNPLKAPAARQIEILYDDEWIVAANKPAGMLSVPGKESDVSVCSAIREMFPEAEGPMVVHRLDMATSGILLIAKTKEVYVALQRQFASRTINKRYRALLNGCPECAEGIISLPIILNPDDRPRQMVDFEHGKTAITRYSVVDSKDGRALVDFFPMTGRTHQLRVHSAHKMGLGCPIVGDNLYGSPSDRLYLQAVEIGFEHPVTKKKIVITAKEEF